MGSLVWRSMPMRSTMTASRWTSVFPLQQGGEGAAFHAGRGGGAGEVDDGGDQVEVGHRAVVDAAVGGPRVRPRGNGTRMTDS